MLLGREFGWTPAQVNDLYHSELWDIVDELGYQRQVSEYKEFHRFAFLACVFTNTLAGERKRPEDFIGQMPERPADVQRRLEAAKAEAREKGVSFPG